MRDTQKIEEMEEKIKKLEERINELEAFLSLVKEKIAIVGNNSIINRKKKWLTSYPDEGGEK